MGLFKEGRAGLRAMAADMMAAAESAARARTPEGKPDAAAAAALLADSLDRAVAAAAGSDPGDMPKLAFQERLAGGAGRPGDGGGR